MKLLLDRLQGAAAVDGTFALQRLGSVRLSMNDPPGAVKAFEKALAMRQETSHTGPDDVRARLNLAKQPRRYGRHFAQAEKSFRSNASP